MMSRKRAVVIQRRTIGRLASKRAHTELLGRLEQRARGQAREAARELVLARTTRVQPWPPVVLGDHARGECQQSHGAGEGRKGRRLGATATPPGALRPPRHLHECSTNSPMHASEPRAVPSAIRRTTSQGSERGRDPEEPPAKHQGIKAAARGHAAPGRSGGRPASLSDRPWASLWPQRSPSKEGAPSGRGSGSGVLTCTNHHVNGEPDAS